MRRRDRPKEVFTVVLEALERVSATCEVFQHEEDDLHRVHVSLPES